MQYSIEKSRSSGWLPSVAATNGAIVLHLERTDVGALLSSCLGPVIVQATELGVEIRVEVMDTVPCLSVDREKIGWAVVALVGSALRYVRCKDTTAPGGSIIVHLVHDPTREEVAISIHDDGPGVPPEKLPHLFVRRPGRIHADGLGLLLVRDIVGAHNGRIDVESCDRDDAHGTSVTIRLTCVA